MEELYTPLPDDVLRHSRNFRPEPSQSNHKFIESFLQRCIQVSGQNKKEYDDFKYKTQALDNFKKKKRQFDKTPAKRHTLTAREKRDLKVFQLDKKGVYDYDDYLPMNAIWVDYIKDLVGLQSLKSRSLSQVTPKLLKADYHGCILGVVRSKCPTYVGSKGIVIQETRNTFKMVTEENKIKVIPKANSVFMFEYDGFQFNIHGNQFRVPASDRVRKRFKLKASLDL